MMILKVISYVLNVGNVKVIQRQLKEFVNVAYIIPTLENHVLDVMGRKNELDTCFKKTIQSGIEKD